MTFDSPKLLSWRENTFVPYCLAFFKRAEREELLRKLGPGEGNTRYRGWGGGEFSTPSYPPRHPASQFFVSSFLSSMTSLFSGIAGKITA